MTELSVLSAQASMPFIRPASGIVPELAQAALSLVVGPGEKAILPPLWRAHGYGPECGYAFDPSSSGFVTDMLFLASRIDADDLHFVLNDVGRTFDVPTSSDVHALRGVAVGLSMGSRQGVSALTARLSPLFSLLGNRYTPALIIFDYVGLKVWLVWLLGQPIRLADELSKTEARSVIERLRQAIGGDPFEGDPLALTIPLPGVARLDDFGNVTAAVQPFSWAATCHEPSPTCGQSFADLSALADAVGACMPGFG